MDSEYKYFLYARKSSEGEDKQMASLGSQTEELKGLALKNDLNIIDVLSEAKSAKVNSKRPEFEKMIARIENGEANAILCWKLDRLSRNPLDSGRIANLLQMGVVKEIRTIERVYTPEDAVILMALQFGMANQYVKDLSTNVRRGLRSKVQDGWLPNAAPAGYLNTPEKRKGYKIILRDPERFSLIRQAWDLLLTGNYSVPQIHRILVDDLHYRRRLKSGRYIKLSRSGLYGIFSNPFYYGCFEFPKGSGKWHKGKHRPMISKEEFDRAQEILGRGSNKPRPKKHNFTYTGLLSCPYCGCAITAEKKRKVQKNGNVHEYEYYHCTKKKKMPNGEKCPGRSIELKKLEKEILKILDKITISESYMKWALTYLHEIRTSEADNFELAYKQKQAELEAITKQMNNLTLTYTAPENADNGLMSKEEFIELKGGLQKEKIALEKEIAAYSIEADQWMELAEKTFDFTRYAKEWFINGDQKVKKGIVASLGSNLQLKDRNLAIELHSCFKVIESNLDAVENEIKQARTSKNDLVKQKSSPSKDRFPVLLPEQDSNLQLSG